MPSPNGLCTECYEKTAEADRQVEVREINEAKQKKDMEIESILVSTETMLQGINVQERMGVITAECAYGMHVFKDFFAAVRDVVGGRSKAVENTLKDARDAALYDLKSRAHDLGANAVISIDISYTQIGQGGHTMIVVVASGTAARVAKQA